MGSGIIDRHGSGNSKNADMDDLPILLVDDEPDFLHVMTIHLTNMGYRVFAASDSGEALRIFQEAQPPIVLMDIQMPGMNGIELLGKIKSEDPDAEVIMITGFEDIDLVLESLRNDASDYIVKPIRGAVLDIALKRVGEKIAMKRKLKEYQRSKVLMDVVVNELIQEHVMVIASDYRVIDINESMLNKLGIRKEDAIGKHCYEISHQQSVPCSGEQHPCPLVQSIRSGKPTQTTHIHKSHDQKDLYYSISCYPLIEGSEVHGAIEISKDITREILMQHTMMQQEKLASIGRLAAGVAHEINNPMTTILTSAMLLQEDMGSADPAYKDLQLIVDESLRCRKIVSSLLDFARQSKPAKKPYDINQIVEECFVLTKKQAAFADVVIEKQFEPGIPPVLADRDQIQQALINLILNAIEAVGSEGKIILSTQLSPEDDHVEIMVGDSGPGIPPEYLDKIFDPFFTTKEHGTGLGLAIAHGIVEQHKGTIQVKSLPKVGTDFVIRLPIDKGEADD